MRVIPVTPPGTGAPLVELARSWLEIVGPLGVFLHADDCRAPELRHSGRLTGSVAPCPTASPGAGCGEYEGVHVQRLGDRPSHVAAFVCAHFAARGTGSCSVADPRVR